MTKRSSFSKSEDPIGSPASTFTKPGSTRVRISRLRSSNAVTKNSFKRPLGSGASSPIWKFIRSSILNNTEPHHVLIRWQSIPSDIMSRNHDKKAAEKEEKEKLKGKEYEAALAKLHVELVKLQEWVKHKG